jgi:DNA-binding MarR family transcriptional regulator
VEFDVMSNGKSLSGREAAFVLSSDLAEPYDLFNHLPYRIAVVSNLLLLDRDPLIRHEIDLDARAMRVLLNIGSYAPITAADIAYQSRLDPYSVTRAVNDLIKRGLVVYSQDSAGRAKPVALSQTGLEMYKKLVTLIDSRLDKLLNGIESQQITMLFSVLAKLESNAESMLAEHSKQVEQRGVTLTREQQEFARWQQRSHTLNSD